MLRIGITGGIGSGKTYVSTILNKLGFPVFNTDIYASKCMNIDHFVKKIKLLFGEDIYKHGILQREELSQIVFSNADKLHQLNDIIHPAVKDLFNEWCTNASSDIIFKESAILFESNSHIELDAVVCIDCPKEIRIDRVLSRNLLKREDVIMRMKNQFTDSKKKSLSDYIIINNNKTLLIPQIINLLRDLRLLE